MKFDIVRLFDVVEAEQCLQAYDRYYRGLFTSGKDIEALQNNLVVKMEVVFKVVERHISLKVAREG